MLERYFKLKDNKTSVKKELTAGITTFVTMAYILVVNPQILSDAGMDQGAVFMATVISSIVAILVMALYARLPFALAPGMGLNAFFAYSIVIGMGYSWQFALTAVFIEGIIFVLLTLLNIREAIINSIPKGIKHSIAAGIGLFIAFIGLNNAGVIVSSEDQIVKLAEFATSPNALITVIGLLITGVLLVNKVKGALLLGICITTIIGIPFGVTVIPEDFRFFSLPPSLEPVFCKFEWENIFTSDMLIILFIFLFIDLFDTVGSLIGVSLQAGMMDEKGNPPRAKQALMADSIGTTIGAILGTSTVTTYIESAAGVAEGGRTGLTSLSTAAMFFIAMFFAPVFIIIPPSATAPALVFVGFFMISSVVNINFKDLTEAIPAFLTILIMPLAYSIAEGIVFGIISYVILKMFTGKFKDIPVLLYVLAALFIIRFLI